MPLLAPPASNAVPLLTAACCCVCVVQTFGEFLEPIAHVHFNVEGTIEFTAVLFVPGMAPFEQQNWSAKSRSIKLYVRRVFISDEFDEDLMPRWGGGHDGSMCVCL